MIITLITILHVIACFFLILVVLLQTGKGAEMGAVFGGGGSQTIFGASGAGNFLTKLTTGTAVIFFVTSLVLAYSSLSRTSESIFDRSLPEPPPREAPAGEPEAKSGAPEPAAPPAASEASKPAAEPVPAPEPAQ